MKRNVLTVTLLMLSGAMVYAGIMTVMPPAMKSLGFAAASDVPAAINHQGVVAVSGVRFTGTGQFRFAIVDPDTGNNVWTNDGSQIGTSNEPTASVSLAVADGVYSVALGGSPMTAVSPSLFEDGNLKLRVWFDDGSNGSQQLSPDHTLSSVPYAMTVADGAVTTTKLAESAVTTTELADNAVTSSKFANTLAVWSKSGADAVYSGDAHADALFGGLGNVVNASASNLGFYTPTYGPGTGSYNVTQYDITVNLPHRSLVFQEFTGGCVRDAAGEVYPGLLRDGALVNENHIPTSNPGWNHIAMHNVAVLDAGSHTFRVRLRIQVAGSVWKFWGGNHTVVAIPVPD